MMVGQWQWQLGWLFSSTTPWKCSVTPLNTNSLSPKYFAFCLARRRLKDQTQRIWRQTATMTHMDRVQKEPTRTQWPWILSSRNFLKIFEIAQTVPRQKEFLNFFRSKGKSEQKGKHSCKRRKLNRRKGEGHQRLRKGKGKQRGKQRGQEGGRARWTFHGKCAGQGWSRAQSWKSTRRWWQWCKTSPPKHHQRKRKRRKEAQRAWWKDKRQRTWTWEGARGDRRQDRGEAWICKRGGGDD